MGGRFVGDPVGCRAEAESLLSSRLGEYPVEQVVYVEERLEIERELYLAVLVDRDRCAPLLLAISRGGIDIEGGRIWIANPAESSVASLGGSSSR